MKCGACGEQTYSVNYVKRSGRRAQSITVPLAKYCPNCDKFYRLTVDAA